MSVVSVTAEERAVLEQAIRRAFAAKEADGLAGISAAVMEGARVLAWGENRVFADCDVTRHAEVVAMARATAARGTPELSGCTLVSSLQPCEMCLSAMRLAGIARVIFAATKPKVAAKYFVFPAIGIADFAAADAGGGFDWAGGIGEAELLPLYAEGDDV